MEERTEQTSTSIETDKEIRDQVYKYVRGALVNTIQAHGPITVLLLDSATKRVVGELISTGLLRNWGRLRKSYVDETCDNCGKTIPAGKLYRRTQSFKCCFVCLPEEQQLTDSPFVHTSYGGDAID